MVTDPGMDTPLAPLPAPREAAAGKAAKAAAPAGPAAKSAFLAPVRAGLHYALRAWRPLLVVLIVQILLSLTVVLPLQSALSGRLDGHAHAPALAGAPDAYDAALGRWNVGGLEAGVWQDAKRADAPLFDAMRITLFWTAIVAWLFGALAAGGFLGTALEGTGRVTLSHFLTHGGRNFGRMLRVGLVFALAYYAVGRIVLEMWAGAVESDEFWAASRETGWWGERFRDGTMLVAFLWLRVAGDLARADLLAFSRHSAFLAFVRGFGNTLRHPVKTFGLALVLGVPALLVLLVLALGVDALPGHHWVPLLATFLIFQLAVLVRWISRSAVLAGNAHLVLGFAGGAGRERKPRRTSEKKTR